MKFDQLKRRDFITLLGSTATWPLVPLAQQPKNIARIGYLNTGSLESPESRVTFDAFGC